ncbi:unnamed protein product [Rotaria sp. Silwood2]|nr:unnamed protein product [Rotaria sp. Silwood2]CAF4063675.1 unnamed protein product [Rotaria sp. Silwood2]
MAAELPQLEQQATALANEEQVLKNEDLSEMAAVQEPETNPPNSNLTSVMSNSPNSHVQQQQQQSDTAINIDGRFGPSCDRILSDDEIVNSIVEASKKADYHRRLYLFVGCIPSLFITCIAWSTWAVNLCSPESRNACSASNTTYIIGISFASLTGFILIWAIRYGAKNYMNERKYHLLRKNVHCLVKLEGDLWTRYVNYLYGSNRKSFYYLGAVGALTFCLCRIKHYQRLIARGYGYIIFCKNGFMLDEMYCVLYNEPHTILQVQYVSGMGLRVYILREDAQYAVNRNWSWERRQLAARQAFNQQIVPLDIYLPNTIPGNVVFLLGLQIQNGF